MSAPRRRSAVVLLTSILTAAGPSAGCSGGDTVGQTFQSLGGSGGNSTGGAGQGGAGAGGSSSSSSTSTSTTSSTSSTGGAGGMGGAGGAGGAPPTCADTGAEPNETESTAKNLGTIDDCDGSGQSFAGVLDGPADVDWFRYSGQDGFGCSVGPSRGVTFAMPARVCKYIQCEGGGDATFTCPTGTTASTSPGGRKGCCSGAGFDLDIDCSGIDDNASVYIRIDNPNGGDCIPYTVTYHY